MLMDFWKEEYFSEPDFDDMYNYIGKNPGKALFFMSQIEADLEEDLFYQLCLDGFPLVQYVQCEEALERAFSEIMKQEQFVAYAADRPIFDSRKAKKLTGLEKSQLTALKRFCGCQQRIVSVDDLEKLLLCTTRGLASTCVLAVNWKILLLMQDLHGCILLCEDSDAAGVRQLTEQLQKNGFEVSEL